jgi:hypothetical protein
MKTGDHVCGFYFGVAGRDEIMLPFLQDGIDAGDRCICVVHASEPSAVTDKLGESDLLDVRSSADTYLLDGAFSLERMVELYEDFVSAADDDGVPRVTGEGAWVMEGHPGAERLVDYESELNRMMERHAQMILCLYDLEVMGGGMMIDLLKTHPKILLGGLLIDNPHYLSPDEFLASRGDLSDRG